MTRAGEMTLSVYEQVVAERARQDARWGEQNHTDLEWVIILGEEFGELTKAIVDDHFGRGDWLEVKKELIQTAAVAVQWLEAMERRR